MYHIMLAICILQFCLMPDHLHAVIHMTLLKIDKTANEKSEIPAGGRGRGKRAQGEVLCSANQARSSLLIAWRYSVGDSPVSDWNLR